jgi:hypothetical protein
MKKTIILIILLLNLSNIHSISFITTAESISWNGAYTSVSDGFEAMLYNPAGLFMTNARFGINVLGSYGIRFYSNSITSDNILKILQITEKGTNLSSTGILDKILLYMPETGTDFGVNLSALNFMTYSKVNDFGIGVYLLPKTDLSLTMDKEIFSDIAKELDLTNPINHSTNFTLLEYFDLNTMISTRAKFLEKYMPSVEKIFVGMGIHWYFPTLFVKTDAKLNLTKGEVNSNGVIDNYIMRVKGKMYAGSNGMFVGILSCFPQSYDYLSGFIKYGGSAAFGIGFDFGFIMQFNKYVRVGFATTDLGFIVFPQTALIDVDYSLNLEMDSIGNFKDTFINKLIGEISEIDNYSDGSTQWWMPNTALRVGVAFTPFKNELFTWSSDISLSDLNRMLNKGYPSLNIATGIEFKPGYQWFAMPIRGAISYNTQANNFSLSLGIGLYLGPVEMEIGIKGIEFLIADLGARELCAGVDLKFEF